MASIATAPAVPPGQPCVGASKEQSKPARALPRRERNLVRLMFLDDDFRRLYADWPHAARDVVA